MAEQKQECGIHALSFTVHCVPSSVYHNGDEYIEYTHDRELEPIVSYLFNLSLSEFTKSDRKKARKRFYSEVLTYNGLINLYHSGFGYNKGTVHIEMKGSAFESAALSLTESDIRRITNSVAAPEPECPFKMAIATELHIYVDDRMKLLNFDELQQLMVDHSVRTKCRPTMFPGKAAGDARSFAFGARPQRFSFYESGKHRYGKETAERKGIDSEPLNYIRVEMQLSGEAAGAALARYAAGESLPSIHAAWLAKSITFCSPSAQRNRARWQTLPAWEKFLEAAGDSPIRPPRKPPTVDGQVSAIKTHVRKLEEIYGAEFTVGQLRIMVAELEERVIKF